MKQTISLAVVACLCTASVATAAERHLHGQVLRHVEDSRPAPVEKNIKVVIDEIGATKYTEEIGLFDYLLRDRDRAGKEITFRVLLNDYVIHEPLDGQTRIPKDNELDQPIRLLMVKKGSQVLLTPARFMKTVEVETANARNQIQPSKDEQPKPVKLDVAEAASKLGFTVEEIRQWINEQATRQERGPDLQAQARAAAARNNFKKAGELEIHAMDQLAETYARAKPLRQQGPSWFTPPVIVHLVADTRPLSAEELEQLALELVKGYRFAGDAYYNAHEFKQALKSYQQAAHYVSKEHAPELWAEIQIDIGRAAAMLGEYYDGTPREAGTRFLDQAVEAFRAALTVYTKDAHPRDWARTQQDLGVALKLHGLKTSDERLLAQAVEAFRAALMIYTKDAFPQDWARTQEKLGNVLDNQGHHTSYTNRQAKIQLYAQAVEAYRAILTVYTKETFPDGWAETHRILGYELNSQGTATGGEAGASLLHESMTSYRQAQTIYTRDAAPIIWNSLQEGLIRTQYDLGNMLKDEAADALEGDRARLLKQAINAYREALTMPIDDPYGERPYRLNIYSGLVEVLFLNSQFMEASAYLAAFRVEMAVYRDLGVVMLPIAFANSVALGTSKQAEKELDETSSLLNDTSNSPLASFLFTDFRATKIFIETNPVFRDHRHWLIALIEAVIRGGRDELQTAIKNARVALRKDPKP